MPDKTDNLVKIGPVVLSDIPIFAVSSKKLVSVPDRNRGFLTDLRQICTAKILPFNVLKLVLRYFNPFRNPAS